MIIVDILISLVAPLIVPLYEFLLSGVNVPGVNGKNNDSERTEELHLHPFLKSLPSAFIGNSIWGLTYSMENLNWVAGYTAIILFSIALMIYCCWGRGIKAQRVLVLIFAFILFVLTIIRIL